jgi:acetyl/propionyl-CoA carboxylase alpha subunit
VEILLDDRRFSVRFLKLNGSRCLVYSDGKVIDALVHHEGPQYTVLLNGRAYYIELTDRRLTRPLPDDSKGTHQPVKAQMPGRVVRLLKSQGEPVERNAAVLVIEAMKMQNEIRSPRQGFVSQIAVREGESVAAGQLLFEIRVEPQP